jgi:gas vesicle protein GvpA/GvpJ/GvpM family
MSSLDRRQSPLAAREPNPAQLADVLERVLDKGIVIAGDIKIELLDIELLTIKLRLLVASADKAREMGIDWWEGDPFISSRAQRNNGSELEERLQRVEGELGIGNGSEGSVRAAARKEEQA